MNTAQFEIEITNMEKMIEALKKLERRTRKIESSLADDEMLMIEYVAQSSGEGATHRSGPQEPCLKEGEPRTNWKHRALKELSSGRPTESLTCNFLATRNGRKISLRDRESFDDEGWIFLRLNGKA